MKAPKRITYSLEYFHQEILQNEVWATRAYDLYGGLLNLSERERNECEIQRLISTPIRQKLADRFARDLLSTALNNKTQGKFPNRFHSNRFVVTGKIEGYTRGEVEDVITFHGGHVQDKPIHGTILVVGTSNKSKPSSKIAAAKRYHCQVWNEADFLLNVDLASMS